MSELIVDVQNKCRSNKRCKCQGNKRYVSVRAGIIKGTDFGYCTHEIDSQHTRDIKISNVFWQNVELERIGFSNLFESSVFVTVFYNKTYDYDHNAIKKPLLIRSKDAGRKTHWYQNVGGYANKRWQRINTEALSGGYPEEDEYTQNDKFEKKLKVLSCRLFVSHRIHIDFNKGDNYEITCEICGDKLKINVKRDKADKAPGYTKYNYSGTFSENAILVYDGRQLTFQKRLRYKTGYYLPIPLDRENFNGLSAYYWKEDNQKKNPLLIEFSGDNGYSYWIENISIAGKDGNYKHDKWRALSWQNSSPADLKKRLDVLNCIYNNVVQIDVGNPEDCHSKHYKHSKRVYYLYSEEYATHPVVFSYKYLSSFGRDKPYNISEIYAEGRIQQFTNGLPFKNVRRFTAFVSPCFDKKPFLLCVESVLNTKEINCVWYKRKPGNTWEHYTEFSGKPSDFKLRLGGVLKDAKSKLNIGDCDVITSADGIRLDIKESPKNNLSNHTYQGEYGPNKKVSIFVTKSEEGLVPGFIRNSHKPSTKSGIFVLNRTLKDDSKIGVTVSSNTKIPNVKDFFVYFWNASPDVPILLGVITKDNEEKTTYYGTLIKTWGPGQVAGMNEQEAIDHQNCQKNQAIPIELNKPDSFESFFPGTIKSSCLKNKSVKLSTPKPDIPQGAKKDYKVESYDINPVNTKISRITYNNQPTDIITTNDVISNLRIYKWKDGPEDTPLLVEFVKPAGGSIFFENLGKTPEYKEWKRVPRTEADHFYSDNPPKLTDKFIDKLNEVNCRVNGLVQLDISQTGSKYCHGIYAGHEKKISVSKENKDRYSGFIGYEHTPTRGQSILKVSSIYNGKDKQELGDFNIPKEVSKVTVYFPTCNGGTPIAIRIKQTKFPEQWLKRKVTRGEWEVDRGFENKSDEDVETALESVKGAIDDACNNPLPHPRFTAPQFPYIPPGSVNPVSPVHDNDNDDNLSFKDMVEDIAVTEQEEQNDDGIVMQEEYEDEGVTEAQNKATFMTSHVTVDDVQVNVNGTRPSLGIPTGLKSTSVNTFLSLSIDIEKGISEKLDTGEYGDVTGKVRLERDEKPEESGFYMFIHDSPYGRPFKVKNIQYGKKDISLQDIGLEKDEEIVHLAVWYWKDTAADMANPLLIEILKENGDYIYRFNNGPGWKQLYEQYQKKNSELVGEDLEQELDNLNCYLNKAVIINLTENHSEKHTSGNNTYCCKYHNGPSSGKGKVTVTSGSVTAQGKSNNPITYYKHDISAGSSKLVKIKYYKNSDTKTPRKRIKLGDLNLPTKDSVTVYVFYCGGNPVLIYLDYSGQDGVKGWYQKDKTNDNKPWKSVLIGVTDPNNIKDCKDKFNELVKVLSLFGCSGYKDCSDTATSQKAQISVQTDLGVTINLKHKYGDYYGNSTKKKRINVVKYYQGNEFHKYIHTLTSSKLEKIEDDEGSPINGVKGDNVASVTAYYWQHDKGGGQTHSRVLLVEVAQNDSSIGSEYSYYVKRNGNWSDYDLKGSPGGPTKEELDLLNCEINDVVQIDVMKTSDYCHNGNDHMPTKVKVSEISDASKLGNYRAFEHSPSNGPFIISEFKKGNDYITLDSLEPDLPLRNTNRVIVYFCMSDFGDPLLVHLPSVNQGKGWFQKPTDDTNDWKPVTSLNGKNKNDSDYDAIVNFLDTINSPCKPPEVTIDIYSRSVIRHSTIHGNPFTMEVKNDQRNINGFTEYVHTIHGRTKGYFTVKEFHYNYERVEGKLGSTEKVTHVSVFYWNSLEESNKSGNTRGRPLLLKIIKNRKSPLYYENTNSKGNTNWQHTVVYPENLQKKLHLLNCKLNNAVVIDVSKQDESYDACDIKSIDPSHGDRMQVSENQSTSDRRLGSYEVYTHKLRTPLGSKFHIVSFKNDKTPLTGISASYTTPILDVDQVKVYFCLKDRDKPLLIYIDSQTRISQNKWYKNEDTATHIGKWEKEASDLSRTYGPDKHDNILTVLDSLQSSCKPPSVIIDISQKVSSMYPYPGNYMVYQERINLELQPNYPGSNSPPEYYNLYEHTVDSRTNSYFTLSGLVYGTGHDIQLDDSSRFIPMHNVTSVSVYYWQHLKTGGKPLLMKITTTTSKSKPNSNTEDKWFENTSNNNLTWKEVEKPCPQSQLSTYPAFLQKKLHLLNCRLNNAVIIDVSKIPVDDTNGVENKYDSCIDTDVDSDHGKRLKVTNVTPERDELATYKAYEHSIIDSNDGEKFHIVGFTGPSTGPITLPSSHGNGRGTPDKPILNVEKLIIYVCQQELTKPLLIYYVTDGDNHNWYKNNSSDTDNGDWIPAEHGLSDTDPGSYEKILQVLKSLNSSCNTPQSATEAPTPTAPQPPGPAALAAESVGITAILTGLGSTSGTLAGAGGLTGLGWWAFKRSRGDPWVRQI
ncbi:hypothetical protein BEWA_046310 [Theileria equi strain WA]|uniref:Uncharacterized protein n=1 Tax=Theileria equi strain WA TaxID=1537102 RepID=L1L9R6_THEEQ|nr:hypothetical protein BEWA_046310 [Theileria equi strain WA]EKX72167.1 hypothetical protein BEWA_046310 [Theileria equi strain WA]|eukprot:XP_004831619.1 hypothetical protein BEWA_046310 [Theileria equi strain WA]